jgi:hypothetical protein
MTSRVQWWRGSNHSLTSLVLGRLTFLLVMVGGLLVGSVGTAVAASPLLAIPGVSEMSGVACPPGATGSSKCIAVGDDRVGAGAANPLIIPVGADGVTAQDPVPAGSNALLRLSAIACPTSTLCVAVGTNLLPSPPQGVAIPVVVSGASVSVGDPVSLPVDLPNAVTCPSAASCTVGGAVSTGSAVPGGGETTVLTVAGSTVTAGVAATVSGSTDVDAVACTSPASCVVGGYASNSAAPNQATVGTINPFAGGSTTTIPTMTAVNGVACTSSTTCELVGDTLSGHGAVAEDTAGTVGTPTVLYNTTALLGVSCAASTCQAAGDASPPAGAVPYPIVVPVTGGSIGAPAEVDTSSGVLTAVACATAQSCPAVGTVNGSGDNSDGIVVPALSASTGRPLPVFCTGRAAAPIVAAASTPDGGGYWMTNAAGQVVACGDAIVDPAQVPSHLAAPIVGLAAGPNDEGFYLAASDGGVFAEGTATFKGSAGGLRLSRPVVGIASDTATGGYWLVASDGGVFSYDAPFLGSTGNLRLNRPVVGIASDTATGGYWLVASDGGVFSFDAPFLGSTGNLHLNRPVVGIAASSTGYLLGASDGGVFAYDTPFDGSAGDLVLARPTVAAVTAPSGGYWLIASDGGVFSYGTPFLGSGTPNTATTG